MLGQSRVFAVSWTTGGAHQQEMACSFANADKAVPAVERANRIPLEVLEPNLQPGPVSMGQDMPEDPRANAASLHLWHEIELVQTDVARDFSQCDRSDRPIIERDPKETSIGEALQMERPLEIVIPAPSFGDVRPDCNPFDLESECNVGVVRDV